MKTGIYYGNPWLGLFIRSNNKLSLVPADCPEKLGQKIKESLKTELVHTTIGNTNLIGAYVLMNSNGIVLPNITTQAEIKMIKQLGMNVHVSSEKNNALGNNIAVNDKKGIVNGFVNMEEKKKIEDVLGVELIETKIAGHSTVGSCCICNNKGFFTNYAANDKELEFLRSVLGVDGNKGTVNKGVGFVSVGLTANDKGYVAGEETTAHELGRIEESLGFL
ncbi:MAG: translation initiation factor IF-6 [Candidatus Micrarchaeota archaeon]